MRTFVLLSLLATSTHAFACLGPTPTMGYHKITCTDAENSRTLIVSINEVSQDDFQSIAHVQILRGNSIAYQVTNARVVSFDIEALEGKFPLQSLELDLGRKGQISVGIGNKPGKFLVTSTLYGLNLPEPTLMGCSYSFNKPRC